MATRTIFRFAFRRAGIVAAIWGAVFGSLIYASATTYVKSFPTQAMRDTIARSIANNTGFAALFGIIRRIDTVAGYTSYKTEYTLIIIGAIWGLFLATKLLRGEEDAGRWESFLAGRTTRARATRDVGLALGAALVITWALVALSTVGAGAMKSVDITATAALFFSLAGIAATAMFMAIGILTSQLMATRHDANVIGGAAIAAFYLVRMVADSTTSLGWLRWASPFGWIENLHGLTGSDPARFVPIVAFTAVTTIVALRIAAARDLGSSVLAARDTGDAHTTLLQNQAGLTIRLTRGLVIAWLLVFAVVGLVFGLVTQAAGKLLNSASGIDNAIARLGASHAGSIAYLGFVFLMAAGLVAVAVAGHISAVRNEEAVGHLDNLLVRRVARWRWLAMRAAVGVVLVVIGSTLTGVMAWVGAASQHAGIDFVQLVKAGLNVAPPAIFVLGIGVLCFGFVPRWAVSVTYGLVVWSFTVETIAAIFNSNHWLKDTSPISHITPAPAAAPNWESGAILVVLGLAACVIGIGAFNRRDLQTV